jgi:hypothetical protein
VSSRGTEGEHEASRRLKTEFFSQMDGISSCEEGGKDGGVMVLATVSYIFTSHVICFFSFVFAMTVLKYQNVFRQTVHGTWMKPFADALKSEFTFHYPTGMRGTNSSEFVSRTLKLVHTFLLRHCQMQRRGIAGQIFTLSVEKQP